MPPETEPVELNLDDFIKNELDKIITTFDGDVTIEDIADKEQNEFVDANDTFEVPLSEPDTSADITGDLQAGAKEGTLITDQERDADPDNDLAIDLLSEDDSNKKVKFSDINMGNTVSFLDLVYLFRCRY